MPTVVVAPATARWLAAAPAVGVREQAVPVVGTTVREILDHLFTPHR